MLKCAERVGSVRAELVYIPVGVAKFLRDALLVGQMVHLLRKHL